MIAALAMSLALSGQASDAAYENAFTSLRRTSIIMGACEPHAGPQAYRDFRAWLVSKEWRAPLAEYTDRDYQRALREFEADPVNRAHFTYEYCSTEIRREQAQAIADMANVYYDTVNPGAITRGVADRY